MDLKHLGFIVNPNIRLVHNVNEILDYIEEWTEKRDSLPYEIDGIVIKVNDIHMQKNLATLLNTQNGLSHTNSQQKK